MPTRIEGATSSLHITRLRLCFRAVVGCIATGLFLGAAVSARATSQSVARRALASQSAPVHVLTGNGQVGPELVTQPDLVTVVPFHLEHGFILLQAELDGRRGTFLLDTGCPNIYLNGFYLKPAGNPNSDDIYPTIDTVKAGEPAFDSADAASHAAALGALAAFTGPPLYRVPLHTMRIGTLVYHFDTKRGITTMPTPPSSPSNGNIARDQRFKQFGQPVLGFLGVEVLESFETIIDYAHQRITLIKLDSAGRRLAAVPAYTPAVTIPLVARDEQQWGVRARVGDVVKTILLDTGAPYDSGFPIDPNDTNFTAHVMPASKAAKDSLAQADSLFTARQLGHEIERQPYDVNLWILDHLTVGDSTFDAVPISPVGGSTGVFGYPFLSQRGKVGFNFRARQFLVYR